MDDDTPIDDGPEPSLAARLARSTAETQQPEWPLTADDPDATTVLPPPEPASEESSWGRRPPEEPNTPPPGRF